VHRRNLEVRARAPRKGSRLYPVAVSSPGQEPLQPGRSSLNAKNDPRFSRKRLAASATGTIGGGDAGLLWITGDAKGGRQPNNRESRYVREQSRDMVGTGKSQSPAFVSHPSQYKDSWFGSLFASAFYLSKRDLPGPRRQNLFAYLSVLDGRLRLMLTRGPVI
jgi:hypothetical protein